MAKSVREVKEEIKKSVKTSKAGKPIKTFSRDAFDQIAKSLMNDTDHEVEVAKEIDGELKLEAIRPAKMFRDGFLKKVLMEAGLDKAEAEKQAAEQPITNVNGFYELASEAIYQYMDCGKKFTLLPKEDFKGSLTLNDVGETTKEHRLIQDGSKIMVKTKAHKELKVKGAGAPAWLKSRKK